MSKISINDFRFRIKGYGRYLVTYESPKTGKKWHKTIDDMLLIDETKNSENPKKKDLEMLKHLIKK